MKCPKNATQELHHLRDERDRIAHRLEKLQSERATVEARITSVSEFIQSWYKFAGQPVPPLDDIKVASGAGRADGTSTAATEGKALGNPKKEIVAAAALQLVRERGAPIPRPELHVLLKAKGLDVQGVEPLVTLSTMLWRAGAGVGLTFLKGHGYWDASLPYEPAGYFYLGPQEAEFRQNVDDFYPLGMASRFENAGGVSPLADMIAVKKNLRD